MVIVLFSTIFMGFILIKRLFSNRNIIFDTNIKKPKRVIRETFCDFLIFYSPAIIIGILTIIFLVLNIWRIFLLPSYCMLFINSNFTLAKRFEFLLLSIAYLLFDYILAPFFLLSFLQLWKLPLLIKIYRKYLLTDNHYYTIIRCFWSMIFFIILIISWSFFIIIAPWRLPLVTKIFNTVKYDSLSSEKDLLEQMSFYGDEYRALLYFIEQVVKDYLVLPVVLLLILTVFHIPLVIKILCADFDKADLFKRKELESKRRGLFYYCGLKLLIELFVLLKLPFIIIMIWRLPFLFRSMISRPVKSFAPTECEELTAVHSIF